MIIYIEINSNASGECLGIYELIDYADHMKHNIQSKWIACQP